MNPGKTAVALSRIAAAVLATTLAFGRQTSVPPLVQTTDGTIQGVARNGVDAFKGVPFAAPPVGRLRWRAPQPVRPWTGILKATHYRAACMQEGMYPPGVPAEPVSENCLYLNVWKPANAGSSPLPVMVWIYGGGLTNGSAAVPLYAGNHLARRGVIVVTVNYRLGVFGFLALPALSAQSAHHSSGDYGLLDQIAALEWVHRNIADFGGDPGNVTVFGQSSGSISISALTASPLTRGLFQKAIGESGGLFEPMELAPRLTLRGAERRGRQFMERAGAASLAALREIPAEKLLRIPFTPGVIVDGHVLPRAPWKTYAEGKANHVSLLLGWNADEGAAFLVHTRVTPANYHEVLEQNFPSILVHLLAPSPGHSDRTARAAAIAFNTNMRFRWDIWRWSVLASTVEHDPTYLYEFTRAPPYRPSSPYYGLGPTHGVEMQYVFDHLDFSGATWTAADRRLAKVMPAYWVRFARTGDPNASPLPRWPRFNVGRPRLMRLGATIGSARVSDTAPLRQITRVYRAARFAVRHWVSLLILAILAATALVIGVTHAIGAPAAFRRNEKTK